MRFAAWCYRPPATSPCASPTSSPTSEQVSHLGPALGHDLYVFDRGTGERVFAGSDDGEYVALFHRMP